MSIDKKVKENKAYEGFPPPLKVLGEPVRTRPLPHSDTLKPHE